MISPKRNKIFFICFRKLFFTTNYVISAKDDGWECAFSIYLNSKRVQPGNSLCQVPKRNIDLEF